MTTDPLTSEGDVKAAALRRRHDRRSVAVSALVHAHGRFQTVSILDFSTGGLQVQGAFGVAPGDTIAIELLSGHRLTAKVAWSLGSRVGAQFTPVLAADNPALLALQHAVAASPAAASVAR